MAVGESQEDPYLDIKRIGKSERIVRRQEKRISSQSTGSRTQGTS